MLALIDTPNPTKPAPGRARSLMSVRLVITGVRAAPGPQVILANCHGENFTI